MTALIRLINYAALIYSRTPVVLRWIYWVVPIFYFIFPFDFLPDFLPGLGKVDDILLILFGFWAFDRARNLGGFFKRAKAHKKESSKGQNSQQTSQQAPKRKNPYEVLGLKPDASQSEIKKAYRKQLSMYHPDKFSHLGTSFEETARLKTQEIIEAYQTLKRP